MSPSGDPKSAAAAAVRTSAAHMRCRQHCALNARLKAHTFSSSPLPHTCDSIEAVPAISTMGSTAAAAAGAAAAMGCLDVPLAPPLPAGAAFAALPKATSVPALAVDVAAGCGGAPVALDAAGLGLESELPCARRRCTTARSGSPAALASASSKVLPATPSHLRHAHLLGAFRDAAVVLGCLFHYIYLACMPAQNTMETQVYNCPPLCWSCKTLPEEPLG